MKAIISGLIFFILLAISCRQDTTSSPPEFQTYKNNPILTPGKPGAWDDLFVSAPQVVFHQDTFYLFYMGGNNAGHMAIGLATSYDGFNYKKYEGNPLIAPDSSGYDAFTVGPGIILKEDSIWVMYFNSLELAAYTPGASVGRATAKKLTGPWIRSHSPVVAAGKKGEWDDGFVLPSSVMRMEDGSFRMYYTGGREIAGFNDFYIGMAVSKDGIQWKKYDDPATVNHPFADSDPVFMTGKKGDWEGDYVWMANVAKDKNGFMMYYTGRKGIVEVIGYAESRDGIHWQRYSRNPVYEGMDDPDLINTGENKVNSNPFLLELDTIRFLYYYYAHGTPHGGNIGVATAVK